MFEALCDADSMSTRALQRLNWLTSAGWIGAFLVLAKPPAFERSSTVGALCFVVLALHLACLFALQGAKRRAIKAPTAVTPEG